MQRSELPSPVTKYAACYYAASDGRPPRMPVVETRAVQGAILVPRRDRPARRCDADVAHVVTRIAEPPVHYSLPFAMWLSPSSAGAVRQLAVTQLVPPSAGRWPRPRTPRGHTPRSQSRALAPP